MTSATTFNVCDTAQAAKLASVSAAKLTTKEKNNLLFAMADKLIARQSDILLANAKDISNGKEKELSSAMIDRLLLTPKRIADISDAIKEIAGLSDPVGDISGIERRPNDIQVGRMRIPLGVIAMIYEARPNVTAEAAALCIKSGNSVILRGGSEALHSNLAIAECLHESINELKQDANIVTVIPDTDRAVIEQLLTLNESIDLVIPRGGEGLIRYVSENSRIPVIQHYKGVCHFFVDASADINKAIDVLINGKCQKPSACNAFETLLVHKDIAETYLPQASTALAKHNVKIHACEQSIHYFDNPIHQAKPTDDESYYSEYLDYELSVKIIDSLDAAISHIQHYGSDHTEVIATENYSNAQMFLRTVNSSVVMVNASSRFSDGNQLGLGSEIGISTSKLHSYGPMGLSALTTEKFIVFGDGQIRD